MHHSEQLRDAGHTIIQAPREADELLAALELASITRGTISTDSDILVRGGTLLLWEPRAVQVLKVTAADCARSLGVEQRQVRVRDPVAKFVPSRMRSLFLRQLLDLALLAGSDYGNGVHQVGLVRAVRHLREHGTAEMVSAPANLPLMPQRCRLSPHACFVMHRACRWSAS